MNRRVLGTAAAGALFGAGLVISGMTDPRNVIGFLDFGGHWNPRLVAVMAGAVAVHASLLVAVARAARARRSPGLPAAVFAGGGRDRIDAALVIGSAIFGVGWGLSGYCPGPVITSLGFGAPTPALFVAAMIVGLFAAGLIPTRRSACESP